MQKGISVYFIVLLFLSSSCNNPSGPEKESRPGTYYGIQLTNHLPSGSVYMDSTGEKQGYRSFIIDIANDTTVPASLRLEFPGKYINLSPDSTAAYKVFPVPDTISDEIQRDSLTGKLKSFIRKTIQQPASLTKVIQPGETFRLRLGFLFSPDGRTRAELFSKGHPSGLSIPANFASFKNPNIKNGFELLLGVTLFENYSVISCGEIEFVN